MHFSKAVAVCEYMSNESDHWSEKLLDFQQLRNLMGDQDHHRLAAEKRRQRRSSSSGGSRNDSGEEGEYAWLIRQLDLTQAEAKSLHLATVEDIRQSVVCIQSRI